MAGWPAAVSVVVPLLWLAVVTTPAWTAPQDSPGGVVQRIGGRCSVPADCDRVENGVCDGLSGTCQCSKTHPVQNVISCLPEALVNDSCSISAQCRPNVTHAQCVRGVCACGTRYYLHTYQDGVPLCLLRSGQRRKTPVDPVMVGILASLVLMFVIICVVLRLFSKAQFRQNRTILNSANARLMNASFLKGPLIRSPVDQLRRGSRSASVTSLRREEARPHEQEGVAAPAHEVRRGSRAAPSSTVDAGQVEVEVTRHAR